MIRCMAGFLALVFVLVIGSAPALAQDSITVAGTGDGQDVFEILARGFEKANPGAQIKIPPSIDSSGGIRAAAAGQCEIGRVARPPKSKEAKLGLNYRQLASTPLVFVVHPSVTGVKSLSIAQIHGVLTAKISNWSELGGPDHKIYVVQREAGDASRRIMKKALPGYKKIAKQFKGHTAYTAEEAKKLIQDHEFTIGYMSLGSARAAGLIPLKIEGAAPSVENIRKDAYKLVMTVGFVWKGELSGLAKRFFDYCYSKPAEDLLARSGVIQHQ
jgi:phosphate transport system substrate-binding protein